MTLGLESDSVTETDKRIDPAIVDQSNGGRQMQDSASIRAEKIIRILKAEVVPALGCTEPASVALAAAIARQAATGTPLSLSVVVSSNVYKNALAVGIPGIKRTGVAIAAALGALGGEPDRKLEVLEKAAGFAAQAAGLVDAGKVAVTVDRRSGIFIDCQMQTDTGNSRCIIEGKHDHVVYLEVNGAIAIDETNQSAQGSSASDIQRGWLKQQRIRALLETVDAMPVDRLSFLLQGRDMNCAVARIGLASPTGLGVGYHTMKLNGKTMEGYVAAYTAAGADARMAGVSLPVMSSAGSGNHGLTAVLSVTAAAEWLKSTEEQLIRALTISHLVTIFIKSYTGSLTPVCGCAVAAGIGASSAIAYLLEGTREQIEGAIQNMCATVTGMICDGGKVGCSLKLHNAAYSAVTCARLAVATVVVPAGNGIVKRQVEQTIANLGAISDPGMAATDLVILDAMMAE
jgi:L-cysteine desulfidase